MRVVHLTPVRLGQPPADVVPEGELARPLRGRTRFGGRPPSRVAHVRGRGLDLGGDGRHFSIHGCPRGHDFKTGVSGVVSRPTQPSAHQSPCPSRSRLQVVKRDTRGAVPFGSHRHRELAGDQFGHVRGNTLREAVP